MNALCIDDRARGRGEREIKTCNNIEIESKRDRKKGKNGEIAEEKENYYLKKQIDHTTCYE